MSESQDRPRRSKPAGDQSPPRGIGAARETRPPAAPSSPSRRKPPPAPAVPGDEALTLPPGALVAMRKSGGLIFRSREIVVYEDGRVETSGIGGGRVPAAGAGRTLSGTERASLRRAIAQLDLDQLPATVGPQRPDTFVYEFAALANGTPRTVEIADGRIPATAAPLLRLLNRLLSPER